MQRLYVLRDQGRTRVVRAQGLNGAEAQADADDDFRVVVFADNQDLLRLGFPGTEDVLNQLLFAASGRIRG
jgi:hypothetical protein